MKKIFTKHPVEKRGSIILFSLYAIYYPTIQRTEETGAWGVIIFAILFLSIVYAWYEKVIITENTLEHKKLNIIIPSTQIVIGKQINDVQVSTFFPTMSIITVMTANSSNLKLTYFEKAKELKEAILALTDK